MPIRLFWNDVGRISKVGRNSQVGNNVSPKESACTVIASCESPQCILDGTTEGVKGGMKGWITRGRPVANPKKFRKRQRVAQSDDVKMVTNIILTKLKMRTSSRILAYYHNY